MVCMGSSSGQESCGRCSFTSVIDAVNADAEEDEDDATATETHDPFAGGYIEVDERELRLVSAPAVFAGRFKHWLDETAHRFIYRR